jgi:hypothetical protein
MIDPFVSLAFAIYSNKGAYAFLVGSGVSRSAAIPTGWEVMLDLVRKVAKLQGEDPEPDPAAWFLKKHLVEPEYSQLLDVIAKTSTERQQLLRSYFEPTEEERSQGLKTPTAAHRAIAELAAKEYIRVVVTTNFDRLIERAMEEIGVTPTVISTADQIAGALTLVHSGTTIIKLHGDYLDTRIKNTAKELSRYSPKLAALLDRILDEYGFVVCGWSADWDVALRQAIERCRSRRFTTFWATRSPLANYAKRLADHRRAEVIVISDANEFFTKLYEKVTALDESAAAHPLSAKIAAVTVKRYIVDPAAKIRLNDAVIEETERCVAQLSDSAFPATTQVPHADELRIRIGKFEGICETLRAILIAGCYWGDEKQWPLWVRSLQRVANANEHRAGLVHLVKLRRYPALLLLYAAGIAAVAANKYGTLWALLTQPQVKDENSRNEPLCSRLYPIAVMEKESAYLLPNMDRRFTPLSDHLNNILREPLREYLSADDDYQNAFDFFEYFLGMAHADLNRRLWEDGWWGPVGRFRWRDRHSPELQIMARVDEEIQRAGAGWPPVRQGFFNGDMDRAKEAKARYDTFLTHVNWL